MLVKTNSVTPIELVAKFRKRKSMGPEQVWNSSVCEKLRRFGDSSSIHGLKQVVDKSSNGCRRVVWSLAVLSCLGLLVYQVVDRVKYFRSHPSSVSLQLNYNHTLPFPSVTVCNQNLFKASKVAMAGRYKLTEAMNLEHGNFTAASLKKYSAENITLKDFYIQGAHTKDDLILKTTWMGKPLKSDDFHLVLTDHGVCYTYRGNGHSNGVTTTGKESGLHMTLNIQQYEYMPGPHDAVGVKLLIHDSKEVPTVHTKGQAFSPGNAIFVGLKFKEVVMLSNSHGNCEDKKKLYYFDTYTRENCRMNCLGGRAKELCGCRAAYMPHKNGDPHVCNLERYYGCLKSLLVSFPMQFYNMCNCPVPCHRQVFETDLSDGSLPDYRQGKILSSRDTAKLAEDLLQAKETTSRFDDSKLSTMKHVYSRLKNGTENISLLYERLVQVSDYLSRWTLSLYKDMREHYNFKEYLYRYQIHILENNFMKARDEMEDAHVHVLTYAYTEYILHVEKSIRTLADSNIKDNSSRLCLFQSLKNRLDSRIEIIDRVMENYTTLKTAYSGGEKLLNYKFMDTPRSHNDPATPRKLIVSSVNHNYIAKRSAARFKKLLKGSIKALGLCRRIADNAFHTGIVNETSLGVCVNEFLDKIRTWVTIREMFYYEIIDRPQRVLQKRLQNFNLLWNESKSIFQILNQTLSSMRLEGTEFGKGVMSPIKSLSFYFEQYFAANRTKLDVANKCLSQTTEGILINFQNYLNNLKARETILKKSFPQLQSSVMDIWEIIVEDEDSLEYYKFLNKTEYLKNIIEIEIEFKEKFEVVLNTVQFSDLIGGIDVELVTTLKNITDHLREFRNSLKIDQDFIRDNILQISIFYTDTSYEKVTEHIVYDVFSLLCDIGGTLSLFLGASVLSFLEIVDFLLQRTLLITRGRVRVSQMKC